MWASILLTLAGTLAGIAGGFFLAKGDAFRKRVSAGRAKKKAIIELAQTLKPALFVTPTCTWRHGEVERSLQSDLDLHNVLTEFLSSNAKVLLLTGAYGMGKTFLARYLAWYVAENPSDSGHRLPMLVNSYRLSSDAIPLEVVRQISESARLELTEGNLRTLLDQERGLLIFDALDQLPYKAGANNRLDSVLDFVERLTSIENFNGKIVLVVRDEFMAFTRDFDTLMGNPAVPHLRVQGFPTKAQIQQFLVHYLTHDQSAHWEKLQDLLRQDDRLLQLFFRPVTLARFAAIDTDRLKSMGSKGTTIAEVFRLSFADLPEREKNQLEELAFQMFTADQYFIHLRSGQFSSGMPSRDEARLLSTGTGLIEVDQNLCQFRHASWRDFFVALKYMRSIGSGQLEFLGVRQNNYLVSEFVAGLLDQSSIIEMISLCSENNSTVVKINVMDLLSEVEAETLKNVAHHYFDDEINKAADRPMDEYKIGLYTNAGILGFARQSDAVIDHVKQVGIQSFLRDFFPTKDSFAYYDHSQERCEEEWINIALHQKYGDTRRLMVFLLGEMRSVKALSALRGIRDNDQEKVEVREAASAAVRRITGE